MSDSTEDIKLTATDMGSSVWDKLRRHMESRLLALRIRNDADLDLVDTAKVRGEIKNLKNLLALGTPDQAVVADDESPE